MYTAYFGLRAKPFSATPDPRLFYDNAAYREAYATLLYGVLERKGFIALTGEVGTGKTTLLRRLMDELGGSVRFVLFYNTTLTFDETVELICTELELPVEGLSRVQRLQRLNDLLIAEARRGGNVVLLLDEAQHLGTDVLENLRLISNLETSTEKLVQIVLVGQPELDAKLAHPALRQLAQRIAVRYRLEPLGKGEVEVFVDHRLRQCGRTVRDLFTAGALRRVAAYSRGIPRLINILCDGALLVAYGADMTRVTGGIVDEVASALRLRPRMATTSRGAMGPAPAGAFRRWGLPEPTARPRRWMAAGLAALAVAGMAAALFPGSRLTAALGERVGVLAAGPSPSTPVAKPVATPPASPPVAAAAPAVGALPSRSASPSMEPPAARPELPSEDHDTGWLTVPEGTNVSEIVSRRYGRHQVLGLDLVKDLNPHIADLDHVSAGERLWLPALTSSTLARRQRDGSYELIVTALPSPEAANRLAEQIRHSGHRARVARRDITARLQVHRVLVEGLDGPEAVSHTWSTAQKLRWMPPVDTRGR